MGVRIIEPAQEAAAPQQTAGRVRIIETATPAGRPLTRAQADAQRRASKTPGIVRAAAQGGSLSFADELDAGSAALETGTRNALARVGIGQPAGYGMGDAYGAVMAEEANRRNAFAQSHPAANFLYTLAGGVVAPGSAQAARYVGGARNLLAASGRSALVGGGYGAVAGAGSAQGGAEARGRGAAGGAVTGLVVGGAMPGAGRAAQTAGRAINGAIGQPFGGAARGAAARLQEALHQDGLTPAQIRQTVDQWRQSGVTPEFLNVVGENTRALFRAMGGRQGPARDAAQAYRDTTVAGIPARAQERAAALTPGETRTPAQFAEQMTTTRRTTANANYGQWADTQVTVPDAVKEMLADPAGLRIVREAMDDAVAHQDWPRQRELQQLLQPTRNGQLPQISAGTVERLRMAARDQAGAFAAQGHNSRAAGFGDRTDQLDAVLSGIQEAAPSRAQYAGQSQAIEAAQGGANAMGPRSTFEPEINAQAGNPDAFTAAQIRERQRLADKFGTRDQVKGILDDIQHAPDVRPNLNALFGPEGGRFADAAGYLSAKQNHANYVAPNTNSQTASRQQDANGLFGTASTIMEALGGRIRPLVERVARGLTITERERQILLQLGIGSPDDALRALAAPPAAPSRIAGAVGRRAGVAAAPAVVNGSGN